MNVLLAIMIFMPSTPPLPAQVTAEFIRAEYTTGAECEKAKETKKFLWTRRIDTDMIGFMECGDGTLPTNVTVGNMQVTVTPSAQQN